VLAGRTSVFIADDHRLVRETVADHLAAAEGFVVVGSAASAEEAVLQAPRLSPDVVLMDIDLGGSFGLDAARRIGEMLPDARLIFLSGFVYDRFIQSALEMGAAGYVSKHEGADVLVAAVREVARGGRFFSQEVLRRLVISRDGVSAGGVLQTRAAALTDRERQVLSHVAHGLTKKDIADRLRLSVKTVERHCDKLMSKLDIHDRVGLTRYAIREGLTDL